jgi:hypothetical protein
MTSRPAGSARSGEPAPGTVVAGFRLERLIGRGSRAVVFEATQLSLGRRVALKLLDDRGMAERVRRLRWPEHAGAVALYGTGDSEHGPWLAMRLIRGGTLETARADLGPVAAALEHAHDRGIVHGDVTARNVLVEDGRAYLSDFGLGGADASPEDDRAALASLVARFGSRRPGRRALALVVSAAGLAAAAAVVVAVTGDSSARAPAAPEGTRAVGSDLAPGDIESLDCDGRAPSGASRACTVSQFDLRDRPVAVPVAGTITSWAVRGARGTLALQVLRGRGSLLLEVARSADVKVGRGLHLEPARLAVARGDRVALLVPPGAAVGMRRAGPGTTVERWIGPLLEPVGPAQRPVGADLDRELLLRVDVRPGATVPEVRPLRGDRAAAASAGRRVAERVVAIAGGAVRTAHVVVLGDGAVVVDLFDGARRIARAPVAGADGRGRLAGATASRGALRVRWANPDGRRVDRRLAVTADGVG